jgi:hypothetical protein
VEVKIRQLLNLLEKYEHGAPADPKDGLAFQEYEKNEFFCSYFLYEDMLLRIRLSKKGNDYLVGLRKYEEKESLVYFGEEVAIFPGGVVELIEA